MVLRQLSFNDFLSARIVCRMWNSIALKYCPSQWNCHVSVCEEGAAHDYYCDACLKRIDGMLPGVAPAIKALHRGSWRHFYKERDRFNKFMFRLRKKRHKVSQYMKELERLEYDTQRAIVAYTTAQNQKDAFLKGQRLDE